VTTTPMTKKVMGWYCMHDWIEENLLVVWCGHSFSFPRGYRETQTEI